MTDPCPDCQFVFVYLAYRNKEKLVIQCEKNKYEDTDEDRSKEC